MNRAKLLVAVFAFTAGILAAVSAHAAKVGPVDDPLGVVPQAARSTVAQTAVQSRRPSVLPRGGRRLVGRAPGRGGRSVCFIV